jgi:hypothetical protein
MQTFKFNNVNIRFFSIDQDIYFVTTDANKAFGFKGNNTLLDISSVNIDTLVVTYRNRIPLQVDSINELAKGVLVVLLPELIRAVIRSNKPNLENLADIFVQLAAQGFMASRVQSDQKILPPATDTDRISKMALAAANHYKSDELPQDRIAMDGWETVTEMLIRLGEDPNKENLETMIHNPHFRFWVNRQMPDFYRGLTGENPPIVKRKEGSGFCYPPSNLKFVQLYLSHWIANNGRVRK